MRLPTPPPVVPGPRRRGAESAFTLIEIIVVLIIIAILMAIAIPRFSGAKQGAKESVVLSAAQSYAEVVDAFALDYSARVPIMGDAADWPTAALQRGPLQPIPLNGATERAPYLGRAIPEAVADGSVALSATGPVASAARGTVVYRTSGGPPADKYRIEVWVKDSSGQYPTTYECWIGTDPGAADKECGG